MATIFDQYALKGNQFLHQLAAELGTNDTEQAARILRAVFHTLRDVITIQESFQLFAQLPTALKGLYVEGWDINIRKKLATESDFLLNVAGEGYAAWKDFSDEREIRMAVVATLRVMRSYVSEGEFEDIVAVLPVGVKPLIETIKMTKSGV